MLTRENIRANEILGSGLCSFELHHHKSHENKSKSLTVLNIRGTSEFLQLRCLGWEWFKFICNGVGVQRCSVGHRVKHLS